MVTRNLGKVQEVLNQLTLVQEEINKLSYCKRYLYSPNHSSYLCYVVSSWIDDLNIQHAGIVNSLIYYGNEYQSIDEYLASKQPGYKPVGGVCRKFTYTNAVLYENQNKEKSFWNKTINQITLGDFSEDSTWLGSSVGIGAAFLGVDAPMDIRDFTANVSKGEWGWAIVSAISLLPVIGVVGKGSKVLFKGAKAADVASDLAKTSKYIDDGADVVKYGDGIVSGITKGSKFTDDGADVIKQGGKYSDIFVSGEGNKFQIHHMPAHSSSNIPFRSGPGIKMDINDHKMTASFDNIKNSRVYRDTQKELIDSGKFRKALQMDIDDIHLKFGDKYDEHISEMLEYVDLLEGKGVIK